MAASPPFKKAVGPGLKRKPGPWEVRVLPEGISDGDVAKWPSQQSLYRPSDQRAYLIRLAQSWAERDGSAEPGKNYYLRDLPEGYGCFETDQPSGPQTYKRLFGHPSGKFFDSILKFEPHFWWLLDGMEGLCQCLLCGHVKPAAAPQRKIANNAGGEPSIVKSAPKAMLRPNRPRLAEGGANGSDLELVRSDSDSAAAVDRRRGRRPERGAHNATAVDEEGTTNVYRNAIISASKGQDTNIDFDFIETDSVDWTSERELLAVSLTQIESQHAFIPRRGELVLWCPDFPDKQYLLRDPQTAQYRFYDPDPDSESGRFTKHPMWRAGVVTEVPTSSSKNGLVDFQDILDLPLKQTALNTAGFRVETLPDPNDEEDKSLSKQYKYVPLRNIRPLSHWQALLRDVPKKKLHRSIQHALTCMTSISLVSKTRFLGNWRKGGFVKAQACFLGSELITLGDTVRLLPEQVGLSCTDVMVVDDIRYENANLKPDHLEFDSSLLCSTSQIHFVGRAYTLDPSKAVMDRGPVDVHDLAAQLLHVHLDDVKEMFRPVGTSEYGHWYHMHPINAKFEVSYDQILGRLYEADAIRLWSGQYQTKIPKALKERRQDLMKPDLGFDMQGILAARRYATRTDERIPELPAEDKTGIRWLLSDHRAQALTLATINGLETAAYHDIRTPLTMDEWRAHIDISEGRPPRLPMISEPRKRPRYNFALPDFETDEQSEGGSKGKGGIGKRGRPAGSKIIDGKLYTADMLRDLTGQRNNNNTTANEPEVLDLGDDVDEEDDEEHATPPTGSQSQGLRKSAMVNAAMRASDSDEPDLKTAYDFDTDEDEMARAPTVSAFQKPHGKTPARLPPSKAQIMESVEDGADSALDQVGTYDGGVTEDSEDEDIDYASWGAAKYARGGTEESEGGDYRP